MLDYVKLYNSAVPQEDWPTIIEYFEEFDTYEKRSDALIAKITFQGCQHCGGSTVRKHANGRSVYCSSCRRNSFLTAGTFFVGCSRLDAYHAVITLLEKGVRLNANQVSQWCDVSYETAWLILKKLQILMASQNADNVKETPSAMFQEIFIRRTDQSPAFKHPREEEDYLSDKQDVVMTEVTNEPPSACPQGKTPEADELLVLLKDAPMSMDEIIEQTGKPLNDLSYHLFNLELDGLVERIAGDQYRCKLLAPAPLRIDSVQIFGASEDLVDEDVASRVSFIKQIFFGIGRKYLPETLALFGFLKDKLLWTENSLWQLCMRSDSISRRQVKERETPRWIKFPLVSSVAAEFVPALS